MELPVTRNSPALEFSIEQIEQRFKPFTIPETRLVAISDLIVQISLEYRSDVDEDKQYLYENSSNMQKDLQLAVVSLINSTFSKGVARGRGFVLHQIRKRWKLFTKYVFSHDSKPLLGSAYKYKFMVEFVDDSDDPSWSSGGTIEIAQVEGDVLGLGDDSLADADSIRYSFANDDFNYEGFREQFARQPIYEQSFPSNSIYLNRVAGSNSGIVKNVHKSCDFFSNIQPNNNSVVDSNRQSGWITNFRDKNNTLNQHIPASNVSPGHEMTGLVLIDTPWVTQTNKDKKSPPETAISPTKIPKNDPFVLIIKTPLKGDYIYDDMLPKDIQVVKSSAEADSLDPFVHKISGKSLRKTDGTKGMESGTNHANKNLKHSESYADSCLRPVSASNKSVESETNESSTSLTQLLSRNPEDFTLDKGRSLLYNNTKLRNPAKAVDYLKPSDLPSFNPNYSSISGRNSRRTTTGSIPYKDLLKPSNQLNFKPEYASTSERYNRRITTGSISNIGSKHILRTTEFYKNRPISKTGFRFSSEIPKFDKPINLESKNALSCLFNSNKSLNGVSTLYEEISRSAKKPKHTLQQDSPVSLTDTGKGLTRGYNPRARDSIKVGINDKRKNIDANMITNSAQNSINGSLYNLNPLQGPSSSNSNVKTPPRKSLNNGSVREQKESVIPGIYVSHGSDQTVSDAPVNKKASTDNLTDTVPSSHDMGAPKKDNRKLFFDGSGIWKTIEFFENITTNLLTPRRKRKAESYY